MRRESQDFPWLTPVGLIFEGGLGIVAYVLGWYYDVPPLASFRWDGQAVVSGLLATVPMLLLLAFSIWKPVGPLASIRRTTEEVIRPLFAGCTTLEFAILSVAAGLGEEMLFRGFCQALWIKSMGVWPGILLASAVFGAFHWITHTYLVFAMLIGVYLGWIWLATGNLLTVIVTHALYDFVALMVIARIPPTNKASNDTRAKNDRES